MTSRQARRRSAEALARSFQLWRETVPPTPEPMEIEAAPDSSTHARARGSSQKSRKSSSSTHARAGGSSQPVDVSAKTSAHAKREGKKPIEPSTPNDSGEPEEDEPKVTRKPHKKSKPSAAQILEALLARGFEGTRYPHRETMKELGIARDVEYLYETGGLSEFMKIQLEAYKEETCHFLSSLAVHFYDEEPDYESDGGPGFITFTCRGRSYSLTIKEMGTLYGFAEGDEPVQDFDHEELQQLWSTIGDNAKPFSSSRSKSSSIRSPVLRYLHKTIASTMFARKVTGTVNEGELKMLDLCLLPLLGYTKGGLQMMGDRADANLTFVLLEQFLYYKEWAMRMHKMDSGGELCIGGIITPILVACDVELISEPYPPRWIDVDFLRRCRFLDHTTPSDVHIYKFLHPTVGDTKLRLPCTDLTKVRTGENIDFDPPLDRLYDPEAEIMQQDTDSDDPDATERYSFEEYSIKPTHSPALKAAHKRIGLLQKWNKFQGKTIAALKGTVKDLKDQMKEVKDQLKDFKQKFTAPTSKKVILPRRVLVGSGSFREEPRPQAPVMEPPRASSFEPRQFRHYERQTKKRSTGGASGSSSQLDHGGRARHLRTSSSSSQLEHTQVESAYTRESMEDSISSFFSKP